jgi:hypothetical protein
VNKKEASKSEEDQARNFYHKPRYFVNVLVVEDPRTGEKSQQGKVLVWEFGNQVYEKLKEAIDQKRYFHDPVNGYNFNVIVKKKAEYPSYESSFFSMEKSAIPDDKIDSIGEKIVDLQKFAVGKGPKPYDELKALMEGNVPVKKEKEFDSATGKTTVRPQLDEAVELDETPTPAATPAKKEPVKQMSDDELMKALDDIEL